MFFLGLAVGVVLGAALTVFAIWQILEGMRGSGL